jgi:CubicO group peptidase (beta-lactamase class C family)
VVSGRSRGSIACTGALVALGVCVVLGLGASEAGAAIRCQPPGTGEDWSEVDPAAAGMDAQKIRDAIALGSENGSLAIRVYRHGCRVGEDDAADLSRTAQYESWSLAKSVTALVFGRAMTLGLAGPDDPLGSLVAEADRAHGEITLRDLLTMTSGLHWNGFRDYNILMPNRIHEALTVPVEKEPGTYWEYSQSGPALLAEAVQRAVGEDFQSFAQRELFGPLGIAPERWFWRRDAAGHTQGFFGLNMSADDFGRLGELMRRGGVWRGKRLLSLRFVNEAAEPVPENGCYGWLIWLNASKPCVGPRITERPVTDERSFPSLPADAFQYSGLFGQWVTVFPTQGVVVVRTGVDTATFDGDTAWQEEMYARILDSITDDETGFPKPHRDADNVSDEDVDRGFFEAGAKPGEFIGAGAPPPLPPAGAARARATLIELGATRVGPQGTAKMRLRCPPRWAPGLQPRCIGHARLGRVAPAERYRIGAGRSRSLRFQLEAAALRRLERKGKLALTVSARNRDHLEGTVARRQVVLRAR